MSSSKIKLFVIGLFCFSTFTHAADSARDLNFVIQVLNAMGADNENVYAQAGGFWFRRAEDIAGVRYTGFSLVRLIGHEDYGSSSVCMETQKLTSESEVREAFDTLLNDVEQQKKIIARYSRIDFSFNYSTSHLALTLTTNVAPPNLMHLRSVKKPESIKMQILLPTVTPICEPLIEASKEENRCVSNSESDPEDPKELFKKLFYAGLKKPIPKPKNEENS
jgi:hypothetical protein